MRVVETPEVGEPVGQRKGGFHSRQRGVDRHGPCNLVGDDVLSGGEGSVQPVCFPAEPAEFRVGLGVLIAQVGVRCLNFLGDDVREVGGLLRIQLRLGERRGYPVRHTHHREPADRASAEEEDMRSENPTVRI